ncbi:MAG: hypothetical protein DWP97_06805 [Calditrichaeota bacterium]|nr:MAG: hypothetical protein DWP97_06805 [Calditrichota bacterium]
MRFKLFITLSLVAVFALGSLSFADGTEEELTQKFLSRYEKTHVQKLSFITVHTNFNRINRNNDYNDFANYESNNFNSGNLSWLNDPLSFGMDFGVILSERYAWSFGFDVWSGMGEQLSGSYFYAPSGTTIENPQSDISLWGIQTGVQYYFYNKPEQSGELKSLALRSGVTVGYYQVKWDLWQEYSNLNLATATSEAENSTFEDSGPSIELGLGADYPLNLWGLNLGVDFSYLYLNFDQVGWYNSQDEEVVASFTGNEEGRVDLDFSGFRGKVEFKRFFSL